MPRVREVGSVIPPNTPETFKLTEADVGTVDAAKLVETKPQNSSPGGIDFGAAIAKLNTGIVPSWLTEDIELEAVNQPRGNYIGFVEVQNKNFATLAQKGMKVGDTFAFINGEFIKLDPFRYFLFDSVAYRTFMTSTGAFPFATKDISTHPRDIVAQYNLTFDPKYLYNHYVCLLVIFHNGRLIPIRADFRGPKEHAGSFATRAVNAAKTTEWLKESPSHMVTAQMPIHYARVVHTCTLMKDVGKVSGKELFRAHCSSVPATVEQMTAFISALQDPAFNEELDNTRNYFESRLEQLDKICEKCSTPPVPPAK
jgi:hypothetical protein